MRTLIFLLPLTLLLSSTNIYAANYNTSKFSDKIVKNFIEETTEIISKANNTKNTDDVVPFLEDHINDDATFESKITYNMPNLPGQDQTLYLTKKDYISNIVQGVQNVDHQTSEIEVTDIDFSNNKRKATIKTQGTDEALMQMPDTSGYGGGTQTVRVSGTSECTQELILNNSDVLQINKAVCTTVINFESP